MPQIAVMMCRDNKNLDNCVSQVSKERIFIANGEFTLSKVVNNLQRVTIDHNELECKDKFGSKCFYLVAVKGTSGPGANAKFILSVFHD